MAESRKSTKKVAENRKKETSSAENRKREVLKPGKQKIKATESRKTIKFSTESRKRTPYNPLSLMYDILLLRELNGSLLLHVTSTSFSGGSLCSGSQLSTKIWAIWTELHEPFYLKAIFQRFQKESLELRLFDLRNYHFLALFSEEHFHFHSHL